VAMVKMGNNISLLIKMKTQAFIKTNIIDNKLSHNLCLEKLIFKNNKMNPLVPEFGAR
jgi:hypothetical protein